MGAGPLGKRRNMRRICTICARGGSKGLPGKNLRPLLGKSLLVHAIEQARESNAFDIIAVSSDSDEILSVARQNGVDFAIHRPSDMATDEASKMPVIQHLVETVEAQTAENFETIVDLDVTAPLRNLEDILGSIELLETSGVANVITGAPARKSPYFNLVEKRPDGSVGLSKPPQENIVRRQDSPQCFDMNAAVYVWRRDSFMATPQVFFPDTLLYEMPEDRSFDIDSAVDFEFVEFLISKTAASNKKT